MKIVFQNVFLLLVLVAYQHLCLVKNDVTIGALFNNINSNAKFPLKSTIYKKNTINQGVTFNDDIREVSGTDSFEASKTLCEVLENSGGVSAIFGVESHTTSALLESICAHFEIPYLLTSWRPPSTSMRPTVLNFFPEAQLFARGLAEVVKSLHWRSFVIIYETEGGLIRMQEILKMQKYKKGDRKNNILVKQLHSGSDYRILLKEIKNSTEDNIILDCHKDNILPILFQAKEVNLLNIYNNYLITSLDAHTLDFSTLDTSANITTIKIFDQENDALQSTLHSWELRREFDDLNKEVELRVDKIDTETILFHDAVQLLTDSINDLSVTPGYYTNPVSCNGTKKSAHGYNLATYMKIKQMPEALTAPLKFDSDGNRIDFNFYVVDIFQNKVIATWKASTDTLNLTRSSNETADAAVANLQKILVIVSSRLGEPYLREREPEYEGQTFQGNDRYEGYSVDLIAGIAEKIGFKFEFHLTDDGEYGKYDAAKKKWTGLIGDLLEKRAHLAVCDFTITHQRREVVDFSMPFMTLGISILYKKTDKKDINMFAFLEPFSISVWIYTATLYLAISIVLYFISRMTPGDWENPHPCEENPEELENIWDIKNCLWLTLGSIMTQGCDILPKGISSRMAVSMWWFFSLIMTSSYTANLAAFLTKDRLEPAITGAESLSKQTKIKYGAVDGGSTQAFFRDSNFSTYQRMWLNMQQSKPSVFEKTNKDGVNRVQTTKNALYAFLMESTQIEYEEQTKCNLRQIGTWLDSKSYGIAMPMNSPYRSSINKAVLKMQESGQLSDLKEKWWKLKRKEPLCEESGKDEKEEGTELALANVGGVFLVLGTGIGIAFVLALIEFLWNVRNVSVEEHMTYWEALKVELKFACNVWVTRKRTKPLISESSSSSSSQKSDKTNNKSMVLNILHSAGSFMNLQNSQSNT